MKFFAYLVLASITTLCCVSTSRVHAQNTEIVVTPAIIDAPLQIGSSVVKNIQVTNGSNSALPISIEAQAAAIEGRVIEGSSTNRFDVSDWVSFTEKTYVFAAGETKQIPFTITAPFTASAGGYYATLSLRGLALENEINQQQSSSLVFPEVGIPLLITIPGELTENALIAESNLFPSLATRYNLIEDKVAIQNNGTVHNLITATLVIERQEETVSRKELQPSVILPGTEREYSYAWEVAEYGVYQSYIEVTYGNKKSTYKTPVETTYVTPSIWLLVSMAIATWSVLYVYPRRYNTIKAITILFRGY